MMHKFSTSLFKALFSVAVLALLFTSCKKDEESIIPAVSTDRSALYFDGPSTTQSLTFWAERAVGLTMTGAPNGWDVKYDFAAGTIWVTSPAADNDSADASGTISFYVYSSTSNAALFEVFVSTIYPQSLADQRANCYLLTEAKKSYCFPVKFRGESDQPIDVERVELLWQDRSNLISYIEMMDQEQVSFFVEADSKGKLQPGNALLGGYDQAGNLLWTWHLWVTSSEPQAVGRYMDRNLGADGVNHATEEEILRSYGMYYQWGRMTPFAGPKYYNCGSAATADLFLIYGTRYVNISYLTADTERATTEYALSHPLVYLLSEESLAYDWNAAHPTDLWSSDHKTLYDPCPKGWRVADNFDDLAFAGNSTDDLSVLKKQFGWELTDGENLLFFPACGRRSWLQGTITNVNMAENPQPWIGYYWTASAEADHLSRALYFSLDTEDPAASEFDPALASPRANGMQVRCIKE